jgi:hypothetical protein
MNWGTDDETYVAGDLLGEHEVVAFPGCGWEVVGVVWPDTTTVYVSQLTLLEARGSTLPEAGISVTTASSSAHLQSLSCDGTAK